MIKLDGIKRVDEKIIKVVVKEPKIELLKKIKEAKEKVYVLKDEELRLEVYMVIS